MAGSIRVLSGNLWWGKADPNGLIDLIREYKIDVFAAQELGHENAEAISSELPFGGLEPDDEYQGMGIALRRPGLYERVPMHYRDARRVVLQPSDWEGLEQPLDFVNVHFHAPHAFLPFPSLLAHLAAYTEAAGAVLLLVGLATRWISIPLMVTMLVAIFTVHWGNGWPAIADSGAQDVAVRLGAARELLQEHGNYSWLTEKGSFVILNNGIEFGVTYFVMLLGLLFSGGGRYVSLDYFMAKVYPPQ